MAVDYHQPPGLLDDFIKGSPQLWEVNRFRLEGDDLNQRLAAHPVLLIHAATVSRRMFMEPAGGLLKYLLELKTSAKAPLFDVYTLDWRSSKLLFGDGGEGRHGRDFNEYRVDKVAEDVCAGISEVRNFRRRPETPEQPVHIVAHCMGAASTAQALATYPDLKVGNTVLATIALFYRLGADSFLKLADDRFAGLEATSTARHFLTPHVVDDPDNTEKQWTPELESMFKLWRDTVLAHGCENSFCDRLWFLYGGDYRAMDMLAIHDAAIPGGLRAHFGAMPVGLYRHAVENCRRGWAAPWGGPASEVENFLNPGPFEKRNITLISGTENQVWHRDSVDRMYEWLRRAWPNDDPAKGRSFRKKVFPRYGHIDLFWSSEAHREVFPYLVDSLLLRPAGPAGGWTTARELAYPGVGPARASR